VIAVCLWEMVVWAHLTVVMVCWQCDASKYMPVGVAALVGWW
jgi:hypothetical protein